MIHINNIETDIADHCNLSCKHCSHHSPFLSPSFYKVEEFRRDINTLKEHVRCDWFKILGGEPLLNKNLVDYIDIVRECGISENIALFTNGILLDKIDSTVLSKLDCLYVSQYPTKFEDRVVRNIERVRETIPRLLIYTNKIRSFDTQEFLEKNTDEKLVNRIWNACKIRYECNAVYKGYFVKCMASLRKTTFLKVNNALKQDIGLDEYAVSLSEPNLKSRLLNYIFSNEPLAPCSWCTGSCGKEVPHEQTNTQNKNLDTCISDVLDYSKLDAPREQHLKMPSLLTRKLEYKTFVDIDGITHKQSQDIL